MPHSRVGQLVIDRLENGEAAIGRLRREGLRSRTPGDFYMDTAAGRVYLSQDHGRMPVSRQLGVITFITRRGKQ